MTSIPWMTIAIIGASVFGVALVAFLVWFFWPGGGHVHDCSEPRYQADRADPRRRWVHGVLAVYRGDAGDPAYWDRECALAQARAWGCEQPQDLHELIDRYHRGEINLAFDKARLIWLARVAQGTGWLGEGHSWQWCESAAAALRAEYPDWSSFRADMEQGRAAWYDGAVPPEQVAQAGANWGFAQAQVLAQLPFR